MGSMSTSQSKTCECKELKLKDVPSTGEHHAEIYKVSGKRLCCNLYINICKRNTAKSKNILPSNDKHLS